MGGQRCRLVSNDLTLGFSPSGLDVVVVAVVLVVWGAGVRESRAGTESQWGSKERRRPSCSWRNWTRTKQKKRGKGRLIKQQKRKRNADAVLSGGLIPLQPVDHVGHEGVGDAVVGLLSQQDGLPQLVQDHGVPVHLLLPRFQLQAPAGWKVRRRPLAQVHGGVGWRELTSASAGEMTVARLCE